MPTLMPAVMHTEVQQLFGYNCHGLVRRPCYTTITYIVEVCLSHPKGDSMMNFRKLMSNVGMINEQHIRIALAIGALALFVLGAGAPAGLDN